MDIRVFTLSVSCAEQPDLRSDFLIALHSSLTQPFALICDMPIDTCAIEGRDAVAGLLPYLWRQYFVRGPTPATAVCWLLQDRSHVFHRILPRNAELRHGPTGPTSHETTSDAGCWGDLRFEPVGDAAAMAESCGAVGCHALTATWKHRVRNKA